MSKDHHQGSNQDAKTREEEEIEIPSEQKTRPENLDEGYQTPTSEEHRIPEAVWSCPPPAPKKRKRLFLHRKKLQKLGTVEGSVLGDEALELFFQSFAVESGVPPPPESESGQNTCAKKRRRD